MTTAITISKGNQYDKEGFSVTDEVLWGWGSIDQSKPQGYNLSGNWSVGNDYKHHQDEINTAILATMTDGLERIINLNKEDKSIPVRIEDSQEMCPECGTYCMGDCEAAEQSTSRTKKSYCTQNEGDCETCSLVNYGHDCQNQPVK